MITESWRDRNLMVLSDETNEDGERWVLGSVNVIPGYNFEIRIYTELLTKEKVKEVMQLLVDFAEKQILESA